MFAKVLIANRGEIAVRIARTLRRLGVRSVVAHSEADAGTQAVRLADEAVCLGPAEPARSYLDAAAIVRAARETGAKAVHPGYGFLSENPLLAAACAEAGLVFVGPPAPVLELAGDKLAAREQARAAGVPVLPAAELPAASDESQVRAVAEQLGFPLMLKARAGGGGKGMRRVASAGQLLEQWQRAAGEARGAFADDTLYLERLLERPRHVEVQILSDGQGRVVHLGERDCSLQRRQQKIIEETPAPGLDDALRARLHQAALALARQVGYRNAGTVEFLLAGEDFYFLEINARLQVEHPVTEMVWGLDLVEWQLRLAAGEPLPEEGFGPQPRGHAIECRLYAEDPLRGFMPSPGRITHLELPAGPGVRCDCGVASGDEVALNYDPILAKIVCWGEQRDQARERMQAALAETALLGVATPLGLLAELVDCEAFRAGRPDTGLVEREFSDWRPELACLHRAVAAWLAEQHLAPAPALAAPAPGESERLGDPFDILRGFRLDGGSS